MQWSLRVSVLWYCLVKGGSMGYCLKTSAKRWNWAGSCESETRSILHSADPLTFLHLWVFTLYPSENESSPVYQVNKVHILRIFHHCIQNKWLAQRLIWIFLYVSIVLLNKHHNRHTFPVWLHHLQVSSTSLWNYMNTLIHCWIHTVIGQFLFTLIVLLAMAETCKKTFLSNRKYQRRGNYNLTFNVYIVHYKVPLVK